MPPGSLGRNVPLEESKPVLDLCTLTRGEDAEKAEWRI